MVPSSEARVPSTGGADSQAALRLASLLIGAGMAVLALAWTGALPGLAPGIFSAHMTMHVLNVAVAAPLIAIGLSRTRFDPATRWPRLFSPVPASVVELVVIWGWHAPVLHRLARHSGGGVVLEQAMFFAAALLVWCSAFGGPRALSRERAGAGIAGLLMTSMHMTLLGALLALAPRDLYGHGTTASANGLAAVGDQQLGGVIMLAGGGVSYLVGALVLLAGLLQRREA